jgi:uncharacterized protein (DUF2384 family)
LARRIAAVLGSRASVASDADLAQLATKGLPAESVKRLAAIGLAARDLEFIILSPLAMMRTEIGARLVEELLWRIDEGYAA